MTLTQREVATLIANEEAELRNADMRADRSEKEAIRLVLEYMTNVARLYAIPMCTLERKLNTQVLAKWGNG